MVGQGSVSKCLKKLRQRIQSFSWPSLGSSSAHSHRILLSGRSKMPTQIQEKKLGLQPFRGIANHCGHPQQRPFIFISIILDNIRSEIMHLAPCLFKKNVDLLPLWYISYSVSQSIQLLSRVWLFATPWTTARQASLSVTNSWSPPKPMSIVSVMSSNHLILCRHLLLLPSIFPSIRVFSNESALRIRWSKYQVFQLQHQSLQWTPRTDLL